MKPKWRSWKKWMGIGLAVLLVADAGLAIFLWRSTRQDPVEMRAQRARLTIEAKLLRADIARGEKIRASLPQVRRDCDSFYQGSFLDPITGYSDIETDLDAIASKDSVKTTGFRFKQKEVKDRGVTEIVIGTTVDADYPALMEFINGLERSRYFYLLDTFLLTTGSSGTHLDIGLHTFFRT
jgi:hypothetical protein